MYPSVKILKKSCKKYWYNFWIIDKVSKNLFQITNWNKFFFANNHSTGMFPINNHFSSSVVADKAFCYQILDKHNFRIPKWKHFFIKDYYNWFIDKLNLGKNILDYVKEIGYPVFIKPNNASLWNWAEVIYNKSQLTKHLSIIKEISNICIVQEFIKAPEYRIFVVNGEIQFSYKRSAASLTWDWKNSIKKLLKKTSNEIFIQSLYLLRELNIRWLNLNSILDKDIIIPLQWKSNISAWWDISELKIKHWIKLEKWVKNLVSKFNIWVTGIDIFAPKGINSPWDLIIIELNSNPSLVWIYKLGYKNLVFNIWNKILTSYFWKNDNRKYRNISLFYKKNKLIKNKIKSSI